MHKSFEKARVTNVKRDRNKLNCAPDLNVAELISPHLSNKSGTFAHCSEDGMGHIKLALSYQALHNDEVPTLSTPKMSRSPTLPMADNKKFIWATLAFEDERSSSLSFMRGKPKIKLVPFLTC